MWRLWLMAAVVQSYTAKEGQLLKVTRTLEMVDNQLTRTMTAVIVDAVREDERRNEGPLEDFFGPSVQKALHLIDHKCASASAPPRLAPLAYAHLGTHVIMQASDYLVLQLANPNKTAQSLHWCPLALLRHVYRNDTSSLATLDGMSAYDVWITINVELVPGFATGDSECNIAQDAPGYYSATTTFLHEIIHGMGIYSLINGYETGGYYGYGSIYDSSIRDEGGDLLLHGQTIPTGESLGGRVLTMSGIPLYNPVVYNPGSSLSHFDWGYIMSYAISSGECQYDLTDAFLGALRELGWSCPSNSLAYQWNDSAATKGTLELGGVGEIMSSGASFIPTWAIILASTLAGVIVLIGCVWCIYNISKPSAEQSNKPPVYKYKGDEEKQPLKNELNIDRDKPPQA